VTVLTVKAPGEGHTILPTNPGKRGNVVNKGGPGRLSGPTEGGNTGNIRSMMRPPCAKKFCWEHKGIP